MERISIKHVNNLHNDWLHALGFYKQELDIMRNRLTEVAGKNTGSEMLTHVEQFENQIQLKKENIDVLTHNIKENVSRISAQAEESPAGYIDGDLQFIHNNLGDNFKREEISINELRHSFNTFAAQWL